MLGAKSQSEPLFRSLSFPDRELSDVRSDPYYGIGDFLHMFGSFLHSYKADESYEEHSRLVSRCEFQNSPIKGFSVREAIRLKTTQEYG